MHTKKDIICLRELFLFSFSIFRFSHEWRPEHCNRSIDCDCLLIQMPTTMLTRSSRKSNKKKQRAHTSATMNASHTKHVNETNMRFAAQPNTSDANICAQAHIQSAFDLWRRLLLPFSWTIARRRCLVYRRLLVRVHQIPRCGENSIFCFNCSRAQIVWIRGCRPRYLLICFPLFRCSWIFCFHFWLNSVRHLRS